MYAFKAYCQIVSKSMSQFAKPPAVGWEHRNVLYLFAFKGEEFGSTNVITGLFPTGKQNSGKPTSGV